MWYDKIVASTLEFTFLVAIVKRSVVSICSCYAIIAHHAPTCDKRRLKKIFTLKGSVPGRRRKGTLLRGQCIRIWRFNIYLCTQTHSHSTENYTCTPTFTKVPFSTLRDEKCKHENTNRGCCRVCTEGARRMNAFSLWKFGNPFPRRRERCEQRPTDSLIVRPGVRDGTCPGPVFN